LPPRAVEEVSRVPSYRVELQSEVAAPRVSVYGLVASSEGLASWLDAADFTARVGGPVRLRLRDAVAVGSVLALDPPQHVSFTWDWEDEPLGLTTVVAFDAIDHGDRTHLTIRHVGFRDQRTYELHDALWRHWFGRLSEAARRLGGKPETTHP
jgi:uncharacterized protein YndB with AHSA1/START domain